MKKNLEWLKEEIGTEMIQLEPNRKERWSDVKYQTLRNVAQKISQLDETEVLSDKWIDEHEIHYNHWVGAVPVTDLQNLLVPKQELPVIPKFVAEFLIGKEDYMLYELFDDEWLYKEHDRVAKWLYENDELTNKQREIDLVMARDRGYTVEEEQKYYVMNNENELLLSKNNDDEVITYSQYYPQVRKVLSDLSHYQLTEQEIKDYDPRYWAFAKPVEELEE